MLPLILSILAIFLGAFTQSVTGFGSALVAMAVVPSLLGLPMAAPVVAATGLMLESMLTIRYRLALRVDAIWRVLVASLVATPLGVILLRFVDERVALFVLGLVLAGYAVYALVGFRLPSLTHPLWAWITGLLSGLLGGAYNTSGPPIILYGNCRGWDAEQFKSNLSGFFVINSVLVTASHLLSGHYTSDTTCTLLFCLPATLLGFLLGQRLDRWLDPVRFRKIVLVVLVVLGVRLMVG
jgi:uncharacterized membrane protein YfcA